MLSHLTYALKNNSLVHISEVDSGLKCNCYCPSCHGELIARKGESRIKHFAHYYKSNCSGGLETAIHLAAKEIINNQKRIKLPALMYFDEEYSMEDIELISESWVDFDKVTLERKFDDFIPDIIAEKNGRKLLIEVAVTHFIDDEKYEKIVESGVSLIEIDLTSLNDDFLPKELEQRVIETTYNKEWIYNSRSEILQKRAISVLEKRHLENQKRIKRDSQIRKNLQYEKHHRELVLKKKGFEVIKYSWDTGSGGIFCPKLVVDNAHKVGLNHTIKSLRKGGVWNGKFYGRFPRSVVYINNEKVEIFPYSVQEDEKVDFEQKKKLFGQLKFISRDSLVDSEHCEECLYFQGFLDSDEEVICSFRKNFKIK